jgi:hypothetical protein
VEVYLLFYKKDVKTNCSNYCDISAINFIRNYEYIQHPSLKVKSVKLLGIISVDFDITDQLQIRVLVFIRYWRENGSIMRQNIRCSETSRMPMIQLQR